MLGDNLAKISGELDSRTKLVVAVKYANEEQIKEIINFGTDIGFNTLQQFEEISEKIDLGEIKTHFIGRIQSNKIGKIVRLKPFLIQSVSSFDVAKKINTVCLELGLKQKIFLQINSDSSKTEGFSFDDLENEVNKIKELSNLEICGLMTIPPEISVIGEDKLREIFQKMKLIYDKMRVELGTNFEFLSMGMSKDYLIAIEEGANMVRIGRKIFE